MKELTDSTTSWIHAKLIYFRPYFCPLPHYPLYIPIANLKVTFDMSSMHLMSKVLKLINVLPKITALFHWLNSSVESSVHVNGMNSDWFFINSDVRQGCMFALNLCIRVISYLMTKVSA